MRKLNRKSKRHHAKMFGAAASKNEARYAVSGSGLRAAGSVLYWLEDGCEADLPRCARALPTCEPDGAALADTFVGLQNMFLKQRTLFRDRRDLHHSGIRTRAKEASHLR